MKKLIFTTLITAATAHGGLFDTKDHGQRIHAEDQITAIKAQLEFTRTQFATSQLQLQQEHLTSARWQSTCMILGIACPILLVLGATLGASTRRKYTKE